VHATPPSSHNRTTELVVINNCWDRYAHRHLTSRLTIASPFSHPYRSRWQYNRSNWSYAAVTCTKDTGRIRSKLPVERSEWCTVQSLVHLSEAQQVVELAMTAFRIVESVRLQGYCHPRLRISIYDWWASSSTWRYSVDTLHNSNSSNGVLFDIYGVSAIIQTKHIEVLCTFGYVRRYTPRDRYNCMSPTGAA